MLAEDRDLAVNPATLSIAGMHVAHSICSASWTEAGLPARLMCSQRTESLQRILQLYLTIPCMHAAYSVCSALVDRGWAISQADVLAGDRELAACTFAPVISSASRQMLAGKGQLQQDFLARQAFFTEAQRWVEGTSRGVKQH